MVDLMMWLVIAALLLASAIQSIGYYQKAAYLNNMKQAASVAGTNAFAVAADEEGLITKTVVDTAVTDTTWSEGMSYTVEESSVEGSSPYLRVTNTSVTDQDVIYLFESCGDTYSEGVNVVPKEGTLQLEECGVTPASTTGGSAAPSPQDLDGDGIPNATDPTTNGVPNSGTMTTVWDTSIVPEWGPPCTIITIPLTGTVNATIDWGNGEVESFTTESIAANGLPTKTYTGTPGVKTITINGSFSGWVGANWDEWSSQCLTKVTQWDETGTTDAEAGFYSAMNLTEVDRVPTTVTNYRSLFEYATSFNDDISNWDVSNVTSTNNMFSDASSFNQDLDAWDKSNITDMSGMFSWTSYNQDVTDWDMSNVTDISGMFRYNATFNQDISGWNISSVKKMGRFFSGMTSFTQDLSGWNTSNVEDMSGLFQYSNYAVDLSGWDTSNVTDMSYLMFMTSYVNPSVSNWDTSSVTNLSGAFMYASHIPDLSGWSTANVTEMNSTFSGTKTPVTGIANWDVRNVKSMISTFSGLNDPATDLIPNISNWKTDSLTDARNMFANNTATVWPNLTTWNMSNLTSASQMFAYTSFNQNINGWGAANLQDASYMFNENKAYNQPMDNWNTSNVTTMKGMFVGASAFNQNIGSWNTSNVTDMNTMFHRAYQFNQNIGSWNVSKVTDMRLMFSSATKFNQNLSGWTTGYPANTYPSYFSSDSALTKANHPLAFQSAPFSGTGKWTVG